MCCRKLYNYLKVAPYVADQQADDEDYSTSAGVRVLGIVIAEHKYEYTQELYVVVSTCSTVILAA